MSGIRTGKTTIIRNNKNKSTNDSYKSNQSQLISGKGSKRSQPKSGNDIHPQKFEDLVHQILKNVQFQVKVIDDKGLLHEPKEWFVVPLSIVDAIIRKIADGTIINYSYNSELRCLESF